MHLLGAWLPRPGGLRKRPTKRAVRETVHETARLEQKEIAPEDSQERFLVYADLGAVPAREFFRSYVDQAVSGVFTRVGLSRMLGVLPSRAVAVPESDGYVLSGGPPVSSDMVCLALSGRITPAG